MTDVVVKPGGLFDVQAAASAIFQPKPLDGMFVASGYLDVFPVSSMSRNNPLGVFKVEPSARVQNMADMLLCVQVRIYNTRDGGNLARNSMVSID
jgi:hypothetical protein